MNPALRLGLFGLIAAAIAIGAASLIAYRTGQAQGQAALDDRLDAGTTIQRQIFASGLQTLQGQAMALSDDRAFSAYIAAALAQDPADTLSIRDLLEERGNELGVVASLVIDATGTAIVGTGALRTVSGDSAALPGVDAVLADAAATEGIWLHENVPYQVALAPLRQGPLLQGVLALARPVNVDLLTEMTRESRLDAHLALAASPQPEIVVASVDAAPVPAAFLAALAVTTGGSAAAEPAAADRIDRSDGQWRARATALDDFGATAWLISSVPAADLSSMAGDQRTLIVTTSAAAVVAVLSALVLLLATRARAGHGHDSSTAAPAVAARQPRQAVNQDQRRSRELEAYLAREIIADSNGDATVVDDPPVMTAPVLLARRYQVLATLAQGSSSAVHRALDRHTDTVVTVIELKSAKPRDTARNFRVGAELKRALPLAHPNLARILDVSQEHGVVLIVIEQVTGTRLQTLLARHGALPVQAGILVAKRLCAGIRELHDAGVPLRRLGTAQVVFQADGRVKLLPIAVDVAGDPHLAAHVQDSADAWLHADRRNDIQAFGQLMREIFTGRADGALSALPPALQAIISRCQPGDSARSYTTMQSVSDDLDRI